MDREVKYKIIMCNLSATGYGEGLITGENNYLVILYKDNNNKARYEMIDLELDINLIEFTQEKEGYIYFEENTIKSIFSEKTTTRVSKVIIPEDIMFKTNNGY